MNRASQRGIADMRAHAYDISMQNAWQPFSVIFVITIFIVFDYAIYMKLACIASRLQILESVIFKSRLWWNGAKERSNGMDRRR